MFRGLDHQYRKGNVTHTRWRNVISLSAVLNFLLPVRGRQAPVLRTISFSQFSSLCRTFHCLRQRHLHSQGYLPLHTLLSMVYSWRFFLFNTHTYLLTHILMTAWLSSTLPLQRAAVHGPLGLTDWTLKRTESQRLLENEPANTNIIQITSSCCDSIRTANNEFKISEAIHKKM